LLNGSINPGQLRIVREILSTSGPNDIDTAIFSDLRENYEVVEAPDGTITVIHIGGTGSDGTDTLRNVEQMAYADRIEGTSGDNAMRGFGGADYMVGLAGMDTIDGGGGADTLDGGSGDDFIFGGAGVDSLMGGAGSDTVSFSTATATLNINLQTSVVSGAGWDGDVISGFEHVISGSGNDAITGTTTANRLAGGAGGDNIKGGSGNDTLIGGEGRDTLNGQSGADVFVYGDRLDSTVSTSDIINEFTRGQDRIDLSLIDPLAAFGDQAFAFIGNAAFSSAAVSGTAAEVRWQLSSSGTQTHIQIEWGAAAGVDMEIRLNGIYSGISALQASDFIL
jgi:Ca2+-binding RTX toxin-like protein